eukprot:scaffold23986_cov57-Phaeocystis_antarctica.AAC.1
MRSRAARRRASGPPRRHRLPVPLAQGRQRRGLALRRTPTGDVPRSLHRSRAEDPLRRQTDAVAPQELLDAGGVAPRREDVHRRLAEEGRSRRLSQVGQGRGVLMVRRLPLPCLLACPRVSGGRARIHGVGRTQTVACLRG